MTNNWEITPLLLDQIRFFNTPTFTARFRAVRAGTRSIDVPNHVLDASDFQPDPTEPPLEVLRSVAICVIDVFKDGEFFFTAPALHPIYFDDAEYLGDARDEIVNAFQRAYDEGVIE
jgi:hypothetical protein